MSDLLSIADLPEGAFAEIIALSERQDLGAPLAGKGVALVFQKPSARTRNSTEMAVVQLGGHPVYIQKDEVGIQGKVAPGNLLHHRAPPFADPFQADGVQLFDLAIRPRELLGRHAPVALAPLFVSAGSPQDRGPVRPRHGIVAPLGGLGEQLELHD